MVEVQANPNIELITYAEVIEVEGYIGNFKAKIRKKPRYNKIRSIKNKTILKIFKYLVG